METIFTFTKQFKCQAVESESKQTVQNGLSANHTFNQIYKGNIFDIFKKQVKADT